MDKQLELYAPLLGRIMIGGFFLWNGIHQALNVPTTISIFSSIGFPQPIAWALGAISIEVLGGIVLIVGYKSRISASILALYTTASILLVGSLGAFQLQLFLANMAVVGGLLYVSTYGSGRWSTDR